MSDGDSIRDFFRSDHDRLDRLLGEFSGAWPDDPVRARSLFEDFAAGLARHFQLEEEILCAVFEAGAFDPSSGPAAVLRADHRRIEGAMRRLVERVRAAEGDCCEEEAQVYELLEAHNFKEERVIYPMADRMLDREARAAMLRRLAMRSQNVFLLSKGGDGQLGR